MADGAETPPRSIRQPGPPVPQRIAAIPGTGRAVTLRLEAGLPLLDAVAAAFAAQGFAGGTVEMDGTALGPFAYVMPALSETGEHAAYYSPVFRPRGTTRLEQGQMTLGRRDGAPFFHCHAIWQDSEGLRSGGHILPEETVLAEPIALQGFGFRGGVFQADPDPETNFRLFGPVAHGTTDQGTTDQGTTEWGTAGEGGRALALRLRPNQDMAGALEGFCAAHGIAAARIRGGVGSTIGARFTDGHVVRNFATEAFVTRGMIEGGVASIDAALVDYTGALAAGRLLRGGNPVLMTYELVLEVL